MSFTVGQYVRTLPHSDLWMMGEAYATVSTVGRKWVTVVGQRSGRKFKFRVETDCLEAA